MILRKVVIAGIALGAIAAFAVVSQPAEAGGCVVVSAKTRGVVEAGANKRSHDKLTRHINHWAKKNGLKTVHVPTLRPPAPRVRCSFAPCRRKPALRV